MCLSLIRYILIILFISSLIERYYKILLSLRYIDVFKRFKGEDGKFMDSLTKDAKGMLSLYEADHLRTTKDCIMDESLSFTTRHLESLARRASPHLARLIHNALGLSQHWNMEIIVALEYITFYEHEEDHDETILNFSKLNFKLLQLLYLKELKMITKYVISAINYY